MRFGAELALAAVLLYLARDVVLGALGFLTWTLLAALVAISLDPVIGVVQRRLRLGRGAAVAFVGTLVLALLVFVIAYLGPRALRQADRFPAELPAVLDRLADLPVVGDRLAEADVPARLSDWLQELPTTLGDDALRLPPVQPRSRKALEAAVNGVVLAVSALVMVVAFLFDGPSLLARLRRGLPERRRARLDRAVPVAQRVIGRYFVGSIVVALLAATVALTTGLALTIPLAPIAAGWIAMTNLIPQIGGFLGGSVFVTLGFLDSPTSGLVCLGIFLVWQQLENHVIAPLIVGEAVDLSPPTTLVAALMGASAFGVLGALLAIPLLGVAKAVFVPAAPEATPPAKGRGRRARRR